MGVRFWLIQRGSFRDILNATEFLGPYPNHLINPDYMGSAEFEFGAIPKAYIRILNNYKNCELFVTDLVTVRGVPFCVFCDRDRYNKILEAIKYYIYSEQYRTKEYTALRAHFSNEDMYKHQRGTNFWWCIDKVYSDDKDSVGDWIAFIGAEDRQRTFERIIQKDYTYWWMSEPEEERDKKFKAAFR